MRRLLFFIIVSIQIVCFSQNIQVDSQNYSSQELIEEILIDSNCIENIQVTNSIGGDFGVQDKSFGYFNASGTTFPFEEGIVLTTGRLSNTVGPNSTLSDDDAANWGGDSDLENILNENNTINATIIEFDFTSSASQISFRYLFASEEYQEGSNSTCIYSDLFGFLIRPINSQQYTNIALVPNTQTPVKVTTVHPEIPGSCPAINETYFESFNGVNVPINFNGQTKVMSAIANVIPNETYHIKLVIADEQNYRYDSAVFLEAGSFQLTTDLGADRLISTGNALCGTEALQLDADQIGANSFTWYKDGVLLPSEMNALLIVSDAGLYEVEVTLDNNCVSKGEVLIEYDTNPNVSNTILIECDQNLDGLTFYNLYDSVSSITNGNPNLQISDFFLSEPDAQSNINEIQDSDYFENTSLLQIVFARVISQSGCFSIAEVMLDISSETIDVPSMSQCDGDFDGITSFNLNDITAEIESQIPINSNVYYYETEEDAFNEVNELSSPFLNSIEDSQIIYCKVINNNQCFAIATVQLNVLALPILKQDESVFYCVELFPESIQIEAGLLQGVESQFIYEWFKDGTQITNSTETISINESGNYTVNVTSQEGCQSTRTIIVENAEPVDILDITIEDGILNNTVTIIAEEEGIYQYSLNNPSSFSNNNVFTNVPSGFHTLYIKDKRGCGILVREIAVIGIPKFFTPNNDGYHDTWTIDGVNQQFNSDIKIVIFDRYGKILSSRFVSGNGWDGTYRGKAMPSNDYWYLITTQSGKSFKGHFSLIR